MSFGVTELLIIGAIVLLMFGTGKLKSMGSDLGTAIKGFKHAMSDTHAPEADKEQPKLQADEVKPMPETKTQHGSAKVKKES